MDGDIPSIIICTECGKKFTVDSSLECPFCKIREKVKMAFWKTFHKEGELFFNYLGSEEENKESTTSFWLEFEENLNL